MSNETVTNVSENEQIADKKREVKDLAERFLGRVPKITKLIQVNGGSIPKNFFEFAMANFWAYRIEAPNNRLGGNKEIYNICAKLLLTLEKQAKSYSESLEISKKIYPNSNLDINDLMEEFPNVKAIMEIGKVLLAHMDVFKPHTVKGKPPKSGFIKRCCETAQMIELKTGIPVGKTRTNSGMIDIVTELMRETPEESRLKPKIDPVVDRNSDILRKGVQSALRRGRKLGLLL